MGQRKNGIKVKKKFHDLIPPNSIFLSNNSSFEEPTIEVQLFLNPNSELNGENRTKNVSEVTSRPKYRREFWTSNDIRPSSLIHQNLYLSLSAIVHLDYFFIPDFQRTFYIQAFARKFLRPRNCANYSPVANRSDFQISEQSSRFG